MTSKQIEPATDENILALEELLDDQLPPWSGCTNTLRSLIARIKIEREQSVRECAEIAESHYRTFDCQKALAEHDDMGYARATTRLEVARSILSLIDRGSK